MVRKCATYYWFRNSQFLRRRGTASLIGVKSRTIQFRIDHCKCLKHICIDLLDINPERWVGTSNGVRLKVVSEQIGEIAARSVAQESFVTEKINSGISSF